MVDVRIFWMYKFLSCGIGKTSPSYWEATKLSVLTLPVLSHSVWRCHREEYIESCLIFRSSSWGRLSDRAAGNFMLKWLLVLHKHPHNNSDDCCCLKNFHPHAVGVSKRTCTWVVEDIFSHLLSTLVTWSKSYAFLCTAVTICVIFSLRQQYFWNLHVWHWGFYSILPLWHRFCVLYTHVTYMVFQYHCFTLLTIFPQPHVWFFLEKPITDTF